MIYQAYWRSRNDRQSRFGFVKANDRDEAFDIVQSKLQKGYTVFAVYEASESMITPQSLTINFQNTSEYTRFG